MNRRENQTLLTAKSLLKAETRERLADTLQHVAGIVLNFTYDGKLPLDDEIPQQPALHHLHSMNFPSRYRNRRRDTQGVIQCMNCDEATQDIQAHNRDCKGKNSKCRKCGRYGHLEKACVKHLEKRKQFQRKKKPYRRNFNRSTHRRENDSNNNNTSNREANPQEATTEPIEAFNAQLFMAQSSAPQYATLDAVVDTGANCFLLNQSAFFETLHDDSNRTILLLNQQMKSVASGIARLSFQGSTEIFRFPALYAPEAKVNILSNYGLHKANIKIVHDPSNPKMILPSGTEVQLRQPQNIALVKLQPPLLYQAHNIYDFKPQPQVWH